MLSDPLPQFSAPAVTNMCVGTSLVAMPKTQPTILVKGREAGSSSGKSSWNNNSEWVPTVVAGSSRPLRIVGPRAGWTDVAWSPGRRAQPSPQNAKDQGLKRKLNVLRDNNDFFNFSKSTLSLRLSCGPGP